MNSNTQQYIDLENKYGAHNYHPLPVVLERGEGVFVYDVDGHQYFDFLSGYSAVNQGHCHPRIISALIEQAKKLTLTSRAFHSNLLGPYEAFMSQLFGYDKLLPMNTGVEAVETALKLCRKWGYLSKGIPENEAIILVCSQNFHGRTINVISFSSDPDARKDFGPFVPGYMALPYGDLEALKNAVANKNVAGFLIEPIQGEAGVIVPEEGFLKAAYEVCQTNNVLFIADEIQTGIGRTGRMLACDHEDVRPDIVILGKALSGGVLPVSAVLADNHIMNLLKPGEHGSTYGGNPLACAVATEALNVLLEEEMIENAAIQGAYFRKLISELNHPLISKVRGKGLLNAIEIKSDNPEAAWQLCLKMKELGLIAKPTHGDKIRFSPPLIITKEQIEQSVNIIEKALQAL